MSAENFSAKRIALENLKPGMVLARDLLDAGGNVLLGKDTVLDIENFRTVLISGNDFAFITESSIEAGKRSFVKKEAEGDNVLPVDIPVWERESFINFVEEYEKKPEELRSELLNISDGGRVNQDNLYEMTRSIMSTMKTKNEVFIYLNHLRSRDEPTYSHSVNVSMLANLFAQWINMDEAETYQLTTAAILHDIGKTKIPDRVLNKKGKLTPEEYEEIKKHTVIGYRILENVDIPTEVKLAVLGHHEKIDGTGYPLGLTGDKQSKFAKIVSICDIYDAMTSNRIYRDKICPFDVIRSFERGRYGTMDTEYLLLFLQNIAYSYLNSKVELSDGQTGEVVFINRADLSHPMVKTKNGAIIDLKKDKKIKILSMIS